MVAGTIFLSGGGSKEQSFLLDKGFSKTLKKKLLYIPLAREKKYDECLEWVKDVFSQFNYNKIVMWTDLRNKTIDDLKEFDAVYFGGGNTFKLMKEVRDSGFNKTLIDFYKNGGHIYGGSAGAAILGKSIATASKFDKNKVKLRDMSGLNLSLGYSIWCHYKNEHDTYIKDLSKNNNLKIIAIPDANGIIIKNKKFIRVGNSKIFVFEKGIKKQLHKMI